MASVRVCSPRAVRRTVSTSAQTTSTSRARRLERTRSLGTLSSSQQQYDCWLEVVPEDGRAVQNCDPVGAMCGDKGRQFLVRTPTSAYRLTLQEGVSSWLPYDIPSGEVLTTGTVFNHMPNTINNTTADTRNSTTANNNNNIGAPTDSSSRKTRRSRSMSPGRALFRRWLKPSKSKQKSDQEYKYLQCFDTLDQEIMIPLAVTGLFSPVGEPTLVCYEAVYQLHDLVLAFGLPVNAQLIHSSSEEKDLCPQGVLRLYGTREEEMAVVSRVGEEENAQSESVEVSLDRNVQLQLALPRTPSVKQKTLVAKTSPKSDEASPKVVQTGDIGELSHAELPKQVSKELKKFKSTGILDKLNVRTVRKERAKLKEVRSDKAASGFVQAVHHDLNYEDFFNGLDRPETRDQTQADRESVAGHATPVVSTTKRAENNSASESPSSASLDRRSSEVHKQSMQKRDLPPIPVATPPSSKRGGSNKGSKDSLYDHLPPAPTPPLHRPHAQPVQVHHGDNTKPSPISNFNNNHNRKDPVLKHDKSYTGTDPAHSYDNSGNEVTDACPPNGADAEDDGYMVPSDVPDSHTDQSSASQVELRHKSVGGVLGQTSRMTKCLSEHFTHDLHSGVIDTDDGYPIDIDRLFSDTYSKKSQTLYGANVSTPWTGSTSQLYNVHNKDVNASDAVSAWRADVERHHGYSHLSRTEQSRANRRQSLQPGDGDRSATTGRRTKKSSSAHINGNATLRSHNLRQPKASLLELFQFSDSFQDVVDQSIASSTAMTLPASSGAQYSVSQSPFPSMSIARVGEKSQRESWYGMTSERAGVSKAYSEHMYRHQQQFKTYSDNDAMFHTLHSHNDSTYPKQGDDSAISVGSKGDGPYGLHNGSDSSFHYEQGSGSPITSLEDVWTPPEDISVLTVKEVSRSLRYIGMKDRVVLRFANEQIDGSMLCSLDKRLLKEGFPELNALEIKKILEFVRGWRPKK